MLRCHPSYRNKGIITSCVATVLSASSFSCRHLAFPQSVLPRPMRLLRWIICIPAGFLLSILLGAGGYSTARVLVGSGWSAWLVSGTVSALVFFWISFRIAPARPPALKWTLVVLVALLGLTAAIGPVVSGKNPTQAVAGVAMLCAAIGFARMSSAQIEREFATNGGRNPGAE